MAQRDAALLCSAGAFPARRDEELRGALGIGGDGRGCMPVGQSAAAAQRGPAAEELMQ